MLQKNCSKLCTPKAVVCRPTLALKDGGKSPNHCGASGIAHACKGSLSGMPDKGSSDVTFRSCAGSLVPFRLMYCSSK